MEELGFGGETVLSNGGEIGGFVTDFLKVEFRLTAGGEVVAVALPRTEPEVANVVRMSLTVDGTFAVFTFHKHLLT